MTDLIIAQESGLRTERTEMMERTHEMMEQMTRQPGISYDGLCASYDELITELKSQQKRR